MTGSTKQPPLGSVKATPEIVRDVMAGGISRLIDGTMSAEDVQALAAAGQAYAALYHLTDLEERVKQLEQGLNVMTRPKTSIA